MIRLVCSCGKVYLVPENRAGKRTKCRECGLALIVPYLDEQTPTSGSRDLPTPPAWWHPKGQPESAVQGPKLERSDASQVKSQERAAIEPTREVLLAKSSRRVAGTVAGISVFALVAILVVWNRPAGTTDGSDGSRGSAANPGALADIGKPGLPGLGDLGATPKQSDSSSPKGEGGRMRLVVPAYFYPAGPGLKEWDRLMIAGSQVPVVAIVNPATGPGKVVDPQYATIINKAISRGVIVVGYVNTAYAKRPLAEVEAEIDRWTRLYPKVRGIFLDAQAADSKEVDYYVTLNKYVHELIVDPTVVMNPGTVCAEEYATRTTANAISVFEGPTGLEKFKAPSWTGQAANEKLAAIAYQVETPAKMRESIQLAVLRGIGSIYVTDEVAPARYGRLPSYWEAEVEVVDRVNHHEEP